MIFSAYHYGSYKAKRTIEKNKEVISSQIILDRIKDRYFLVTKTILADEKVEIIVNDTGGWKGLITGNKINAQGTVRADIGIDLDYFSANDIVIDHVNKNVVVYLPEARILDASIKNDIEVRTEKGLWTGIRDIFSGDKDEEYNRAARELISQAEKAIEKQSDVFMEARESGAKLVRLVIDKYLPDYKVEIKNK